jgi:hypothetical protein
MNKRKLEAAETELTLTKAQTKLVKKLSLNLNESLADAVEDILSEGEEDLPLLLELFRRATSLPVGVSVTIQNTNIC